MISSPKRICKEGPKDSRCDGSESVGIEAKQLLQEQFSATSQSSIMLLGISTPSESKKVQKEIEEELRKVIKEVAGSDKKLTLEKAHTILTRLGVKEDPNKVLHCGCCAIADSSRIKFYGRSSKGKITKDYIDAGGKVHRYVCYGSVLQKLISASKSRLDPYRSSKNRPQTGPEPKFQYARPRAVSIDDEVKATMEKVLPGKEIYEACRTIEQDLRVFRPLGPLPVSATKSNFQDMADQWAQTLRNEPNIDMDLTQKAARIDKCRGDLIWYLTNLHEKFNDMESPRVRDYVFRFCTQLCECFELVLVTSKAHALYTKSSAWCTSRHKKFIKDHNLDRATFDREIMDFIDRVHEEHDVGRKIRELMEPAIAESNHFNEQDFEVMLKTG